MLLAREHARICASYIRKTRGANQEDHKRDENSVDEYGYDFG
jgi:hypothetical protein